MGLMKRIDRNILAIDLKSFYASVECLDRNRDPFTTPLVVADEERGDGTIVLAASPFIKKKYKVKSRCRLYDVPKDIPGLIIAKPKRKRYLQVSADINKIYRGYVSKEDWFVYSIDESFLDVTDYLSIHNDTPESYARKIINEIKDKTGLTVTAGIGLNLFRAKAARDIEAKHRKDCLASWTYESIPEHLWPVSPLSKRWGIGSRREKRLNERGFYSVGDIAVSDPQYLTRELGVIGEEIYYHSHGYDDALLRDTYVSNRHSLSVGQVLLRDYDSKERPTRIRDRSIERSDRRYEEGVKANSFILYLGYKDHSGFGKKVSFFSPTDSAIKIGKELVAEFRNRLESEREGTYRRISIVAEDVRPKEEEQMSLFEDYQEDEKVGNLEKTLLSIRKRYGARKAMPCSARTLSSTFLTRSNQIGGHHA